MLHPARGVSAIYVYVYACVHVCVCVCVCVHVHVCKQTCIHVYMCVCPCGYAEPHTFLAAHRACFVTLHAVGLHESEHHGWALFA
jgi:hypothetical protein